MAESFWEQQKGTSSGSGVLGLCLGHVCYIGPKQVTRVTEIQVVKTDSLDGKSCQVMVQGMNVGGEEFMAIYANTHISMHAQTCFFRLTSYWRILATCLEAPRMCNL